MFIWVRINTLKKPGQSDLNTKYKAEETSMIIATERILFYRRGCPVIFQTLESDPYANYCIQYAGNGHYFKTAEEAQEYIKKRFKRNKTRLI